MSTPARKTEKLLQKQLKKTVKKEERLLGKKPLIKRSPLSQKISGKIPPQLEQTFQAAFAKGFQVLLSGGDRILSRISPRSTLRENHRACLAAFQADGSKKKLKAMEKEGQKRLWHNKGATAAEGGLLGLLGLGLPDIPIFLGMLLKNIYEIGLNYGFEVENPHEKHFALAVLCAATAPPESRAAAYALCDRLGDQIDQGEALECSLETLIRTASRYLANDVLLAKFVQGIPIIGATGGIANYRLMQKIGKTAALKYKKRFLRRFPTKGSGKSPSYPLTKA